MEYKKEINFKEIGFKTLLFFSEILCSELPGKVVFGYLKKKTAFESNTIINKMVDCMLN